jgi:molybdenum cofactor biosynthesis protein B
MARSYPSRQPPIIIPMSVEEHRKTAVTGVRCAVLTISDTRALETDVSGRTIVELLEAAGHAVAKRQILQDEPSDVNQAVLEQLGGVIAIITTGDSGITQRDSTYVTIPRLFEKRFDGIDQLLLAHT